MYLSSTHTPYIPSLKEKALANGSYFAENLAKNILLLSINTKYW